MVSKSALITGCNGFVGKYLIDSLLADGYSVTGIDLQEEPRNESVSYKKIDLTDIPAISEFINKGSFDEIYHLAAIANPREAKNSPAKTLKTSCLSTIGLLEGCRESTTASTKILFIGSSEEYQHKDGEHIHFTEDDPLDTRSIYGTSKITSELIAKTYVRQYSIAGFFTRSFNHTGPGQSPVYVLADFAKQVAEVKLGRTPRAIFTGNITLERDFLDVRDVVRAYRKIMTQGKIGATYNVCSGNAVLIRDCIEVLLKFADEPNTPIIEKTDRLRGKEPYRITGDNSHLIRDTRWSPLIPIERTLKDMLSYWISELGNNN